MNRRKLALVTVTAVAALAVAATGVVAAVAPTAAQAAPTATGYDISWPQCPGAGAQPMPPTNARFVIIGLTHGQAFTDNPCVADQFAWAAANDIPRAAYTWATYPTPAQLTAHGATGGPWRGSTDAARLRNAGYAGGKDAVATLTSLGLTPKPTVWVDVEKRSGDSAEPWKLTLTRADQQRNRFVIEGTLRALEDSGYAVGLYSVTSHWQEITGGWWLPGVPTWVAKSDQATATAACTQTSWSSGKTLMTQWTDGSFDYDIPCAGFTIAPKKAPAPSWGNDVNGDWKNDLLARQTSTSKLWLYKGNGARTGNRFLPRVAAGTFSSSAFTLLETVGDLTGDGRVDLVARTTAGTLWLYPGTGGTTWGTRRSLGTGWNGYKGITGVGDWNGDSKPDLGAIRTSDGMFVVWPGRGNGTLGTKTSVKSGLGGMDKVVGVGDMTLNGIPDVVMREASTGTLYLYPGFASGTFGTRVKIGTGWNTVDLVAGVGDFSGDGVPDVVARKKAAFGGDLFLYPGLSNGTLGPKVQIGTDWQAMNAIA
jgi:hypothetical protein